MELLMYRYLVIHPRAGQMLCSFLSVWLILCSEGLGATEQHSSLNYWGDYESWSKWKVYVIPPNTSKTEFEELARKAVSKNPGQRIRFFDSDAKIEEYIAAEKFAWDATGSVPRVEFPTEWRKQHMIGVVHDRSDKAYNRWQIIYNKGGVNEHITFLE